MFVVRIATCPFRLVLPVVRIATFPHDAAEYKDSNPWCTKHEKQNWMGRYQLKKVGNKIRRAGGLSHNRQFKFE